NVRRFDGVMKRAGHITNNVGKNWIFRLNEFDSFPHIVVIREPVINEANI
ncbi:MAG: hypothetical protein QOI77_1058, partial [Blastocatellia bacterium]|nr:hypothetical protein [Blastocatellia bacterium]